MYCESCGSYVQDTGANFCGICGASIEKIDNCAEAVTYNDISAVTGRTGRGPFKSAIKYVCICLVSFLVITGILGGISVVLTSEYITAHNRDNPPPVITDSGDTYNIEYEWDFVGSTWEYNAEVPKSLYDYYSGKQRTGSYDEYVLNPYDDELMQDIAGFIMAGADAKGLGKSYYIPFALSFVQSLPYTNDKLTTGYEEYPRYPVETMVDNGGDCEDTSILFSSIVREMGYGVALLLLEEDEHMAAGIQISPSLIDNWSENYDLAYYTDSDGDIYAYCETTYTGWEFGELPDDLSGTAKIIDVF